MRLFLFVLIVSSFAMCKSKDKIPKKQSISKSMDYRIRKWRKKI